MIKNMLLSFSVLMSVNISAGINCSDKITSVIAHSNGNIYFNTENVCSAHWCVLGQEKWNTSDKLKSGLSTLLSANAQKREVIIEWDASVVPSCDTVLSEYATPGFILIK